MRTLYYWYCEYFLILMLINYINTWQWQNMYYLLHVAFFNYKLTNFLQLFDFWFKKRIEIVDFFVFENVLLILKWYIIKNYRNYISQKHIAIAYHKNISQLHIAKTNRNYISQKHIAQTYHNYISHKHIAITHCAITLQLHIAKTYK